MYVTKETSPSPLSAFSFSLEMKIRGRDDWAILPHLNLVHFEPLPLLRIH